MRKHKLTCDIRVGRQMFMLSHSHLEKLEVSNLNVIKIGPKNSNFRQQI
jgi:hypothetical protein